MEDEKAVIDCLLYIELNPVRAGLLKHPEEYDGSSLYYRELDQDRWMISLRELLRQPKRKQAFLSYKSAVYYRGNVRTKTGQAEISDQLIKAQEARGFRGKGIYLKQMRFCVDGLVLGSQSYVQQHLDQLRETGRYLRRKHTIRINEIPSSSFVQLREQRDTATVF